MTWLNVLGIAIGLAMDAFAVSVAAGLSLRRLTFRRVFRLAFHFGLFQFLMPVVGWLAGRTVSGYIHAYDHWIAFGLLSFVGGKMLWEAWQSDAKAGRADDPTRGWLLVILALSLIHI